MEEYGVYFINFNNRVKYAPLIIKVCCLVYNFYSIINHIRFVEGEELEDTSLNGIELNEPRQPMFERVASKLDNP
jgi:hypothetical protein